MLPLLVWQPEAIARYHTLNEIWNLGHIILFAVATVPALGWLQRRRVRFAGAVAISVTAGIAAGTAIELLQGLIGRDSSALDVVRDGAGVFAVITAAAGIHRRPAWTAFLAAVTLPLLTWLVIPPIRASIDTIVRYGQFPVLFAGAERLETERFTPSPQLTLEPAGDARYRLRVQLTTARYSGFSLVNFPGDWRGYHTLQIDVGNLSAKQLTVTCTIQDHSHNFSYTDRYNRRFVLAPGRSRIVINLAVVRRAPATRTMDIAQVDKLSCFTVKLARPHTLDVYRIALVDPDG